MTFTQSDVTRSSIRVGVAESYQLIRDALCKLLEVEFEVVGTASDGFQAVDLAREHSPQILLSEVELPGISGLEAARQIKQVKPEVRIIFVTSVMHLPYARDAFEAGAAGYVLKQSPTAELFTAIRQVADGSFFVSPHLSDRLRILQKPTESGSLNLFSSLTARQREVLELITEGLSRKDIATRLGVSVKTIEFHKGQLKRLFGVKTTAALIRCGLDSGAVPGLK